MAKFKIGDRVRLVGIDGNTGLWGGDYLGREGIVAEEDTSPYVKFGDEIDWGGEDYLELVEEYKNPEIHINIPLESLFVTIGNKKYRLVEA